MAAQSPLAARPICLDLEEAAATATSAPGQASSAVGDVASASDGAGPARFKLYVSQALLQEMPYFTARLSERWEEERKDVLYVQLPEGCTIAAATTLFERLHFPHGHWGQLDISVVLQMVQVAGMFLAEGDGLIEELARLLRGSVRSQNDIDTVAAFVDRLSAPPCVVELAASLSRKRLSTLLGDAQLTAMLKNVLASGDSSTAEAVEKLLAQRSRRDMDSTRRNAGVLQSVLQVGPATDCASISAEKLTIVQSESAGRWSEWVERPAPGLQHVLQIATKFVLTHPDYLVTLAPLMFPKFPVNPHWTRSALVTDMLKRTIKNVLDGWFLQGAGAERCSLGLHTEGGCSCESEGLSSLILAVIANGHEDLLHCNSSLASAISRAARVSSETVDSMCSALLKLKSTTLSSFVTASMLRSMCGPSRQELCLAILPNMHTLANEVKVAVLAEIDADESDAEGHARRGDGAVPVPVGAGASGNDGRALKRQRS